MHIAVLGLNHKTTPVELRERLAFEASRLPEALTVVRQKLGIPECVILSTCNRVELYALLPELDGNAVRLQRFLADFHRVDPASLGDRFYWYLQPVSVRHLFRVAAGLESMVLGESEILGQVREAYLQAVSCGSVGPVFHRLFQTALRTGKEVRAKTQIGQGAISVASVGVDLARSIFRDLKTKTILTLGTGQMGETTLRSLNEQGVGSLLLANRTAAVAEPLAQALGGQVVPWDRLHEALVEADIVICSTSAQEFVVTCPQLKGIMAARRQRALFLIDISVPRNLDPAIGKLENVYLYDIDDLEEIASANRRRRLDEVSACSTIVEGQMESFMTRFPSS